MALPGPALKELAGIQSNGRPLSNVLLNWFRSLSATQTTVDGGPTSTDLTALTLRVTQAEADIIRALRDARDARLWDMVPLTRDEIAAITDIYILAETGDPLLTEGGDPLILESA
jgi:hypothetical protein